MKPQPIQPLYQPKTGMWPALLASLVFYGLVTWLVLSLSGCAGSEYLFRGGIETPYGSATTDGKTVTITPTVPGVIIPIHAEK